MEKMLQAAEQISLFCRLNIYSKRELPIRSSELGMLIYLCKTEGSKTPMDIARFFQVTRAMATNLVTAMYKKGYIEKQISSEDRRSRLIVPTEKARRLVDDTYEAYYKNLITLRKRMKQREFDALLTLLNEANTILLEAKAKDHGHPGQSADAV